MTSVVQLDADVLGIGRRLLHALRQVVARDFGPEATSCLQEAGFAAGENVYACYGRWLAGQAGLDDPSMLDAAKLGDMLSGFFQALGWGALSIERVGHAGLAIDAPSWAESDPNAGSEAPSCHLTIGLFSDFLSRLAGSTVAVMEVECRSCGAPRCRFLAGSPDTLQAVYDAMSSGADYRAALEAGGQ